VNLSLALDVQLGSVAVAARHRADEGREHAQGYVSAEHPYKHAFDVTVESRRDHEAGATRVVVRLRPLDLLSRCARLRRSRRW